MDALTRNWLWLLALIVGTVAVAAFSGPVAAALLLALAWLKARAILGGFLHLSGLPGWLSMAMLVLGLWLALVWVLTVFAIR